MANSSDKVKGPKGRRSQKSDKSGKKARQREKTNANIRKAWKTHLFNHPNDKVGAAAIKDKEHHIAMSGGNLKKKH